MYVLMGNNNLSGREVVLLESFGVDHSNEVHKLVQQEIVHVFMSDYRIHDYQ